ncbi:putative monovalent cation/H+ antiporter subunit G [Andreesenia angusta]|uniref:Putative monovalent cation/H+ antiporter subunit G n=1 Tax=Andreesenia angusta TaxID=39480 RepID=A0A1S1VA03_9FIRM|nr:monovalent cation/H(+) antiporter subunit G [Andreesenia angusta]OHW63240.1 putative monovalent cation/H+ antiporter subunit G [Andreesenia angusta]
MEILGYTLIGLGFVFILFGLLGMFKFNSFFKRVLASSLIDSAGFVTVLVGVLILKGASYFSLKIALLLGIGLIINPITTHIIALSAWKSGYKEDVCDDGTNS